MLVAETITFESIFGRCKFPLENILTPEQKELLLASVNVVSFNRKDTIIKQNSVSTHIYYIVDGIIKISREQRKGKNLVLKLDTSGNFVGLISLLGGDTYNFTLTAIENTTIAQIPVSTIKNLIQQNNRFSLEVSQLISKHSIFLINRLSGLLYKQLPGRVADLILYFSEEIYCNQEFTFPVNRSELAELCGTTKESLIRTLSEFNHDRIIEMNRSKIRIISHDILKTLSKLG